MRYIPALFRIFRVFRGQEMSDGLPGYASGRFLREKAIEFVPHLYDYVEKGGTRESAKQLGVDEHAIVKTLIFETNETKPLIVLMHGDLQVSTKNLARHIGVKSVEPATPERASKWTGYLVGGTSPFGTRTASAGLCGKDDIRSGPDLHQRREAGVFG